MPRHHAGPRVPLQKFRPLHLVRLRLASKGKQLIADWGSPKKSPVIECGNGKLLINPGLRELAQEAGVWRHCPTGTVDLADRRRRTGRHDRRRLRRLRRRLHRRLRPPRPRRSGSGFIAKSKTSSASPAASPAPTWPRAAFSRCSNSARGWSPPSTSSKLTQPQLPTIMHTLHLDCGTSPARPHRADCRRRELAKARRRRRRSIRIRRNPLRLHHRRGDSLRHAGCCGRGRRKLRRTGCDVPRRMLPRPARSIC